MANTPQSKKRARQVQKKTEIKKSRRSRIKTFIKLVEENVQKGEDNDLEWLPNERTISFRQCQASEGGYFQSYHLRKGLLKCRAIPSNRRPRGYPLRREGTSSPR